MIICFLLEQQIQVFCEGRENLGTNLEILIIVLFVKEAPTKSIWGENSKEHESEENRGNSI